MAHNLEENNGQVAFALRGKPAWHNLANKIFGDEEIACFHYGMDEDFDEVREREIKEEFDVELNRSGTIDYKSSSIFLHENENTLTDFFN